MRFPNFTKWLFISVAMLIAQGRLFAGGPDTCLLNDECINATLINNVIPDLSFVCVEGCNMYSSPDALVAGCQMGDFPTVWYAIAVDDEATILNIEVNSSDFESPSISLFKGSCNGLELVNLSNGNLACIIGAQGSAKAVGTYVIGSTTYYIAVSSVNSIGGDFEICVSTIADGSHCVVSRSMEIISRANPGPLEGPFDAGEKLRVCMNVENYTAAGNDCQWFQGMVPVFGNGWDPLSFDSLGQPYNATINNLPLGQEQNGVYGTTTWSWFDNVGYHHPNSILRIGDFDNNGRLDLCNSVYEKDCQYTVNIFGGCCGPCWEEGQGEILPPGWFAYGINGSCSLPGPPISVDWGDGNTCGGGMGPWNFCFDIVTRDTPDCLEDSTKQDLTLGFYTFADGEIGAWEGSASVCSYDQPLKMTLNAVCGKIDRREPIIKPTLNSGDTFSFQIDDREVSYWEWNISPYWAMPHQINSGDNGVFIEEEVYNTTGEQVEVKIIFIGHELGSEDLIIKKVSFFVNPWTTGTPSVYDATSLRVFPNPADEVAYIEWPEGTGDFKYLTVHNAQGSVVMQQAINSTTANNRLEVNMKSLAQGLYFVNLVTQQKIYTSRLIKS